MNSELVESLFWGIFPLKYTSQYETRDDQVWSQFVAYWSSFATETPKHKISIGFSGCWLDNISGGFNVSGSWCHLLFTI